MDGCSSVIHIIIFQDDLNNKFDKTVLISITLCHKQKYAVNAPVNVADMYIKKKSNNFEKVCYPSLLYVKLKTITTSNDKCY